MTTSKLSVQSVECRIFIHVVQSVCVCMCVMTYWELMFGFGTLCCLSLLAADAESVLSLYFSNVSGFKPDQSHLLRSQTCTLWNLWLGFKFVTFLNTNFYILRMSPGTSDILFFILFFSWMFCFTCSESVWGICYVEGLNESRKSVLYILTLVKMSSNLLVISS